MVIIPWLLEPTLFFYLDFQLKEFYHAARFEKATRYYSLCIEKDLLGDWTINVCNGRLKSRLGQSRILAFTSFIEAFEHFCLIAKQRKQRKYHLEGYKTDDSLFLQMITLLMMIGGHKSYLSQSPCLNNYVLLKIN